MAVAGDVPHGAIAVLNPSPVARSGLVQAELLVPDEWDAVSLELPDGRRIGAQELSRKQANLFDETMLGSDVESLFRRFHGREVFDHAWNGYRIDGRTLLMEVDNDADPRLARRRRARRRRDHSDAGRAGRRVARPHRRPSAAHAGGIGAGAGARAGRPCARSRAKPMSRRRCAPSGRALDNGLLRVSVADDGTLELVGGRWDGRTARRTDRRWRRLRRLVQLRPAGDRHARRRTRERWRSRPP